MERRNSNCPRSQRRGKGKGIFLEDAGKFKSFRETQVRKHMREKKPKNREWSLTREEGAKERASIHCAKRRLSPGLGNGSS